MVDNHRHMQQILQFSTQVSGVYIHRHMQQILQLGTQVPCIKFRNSSSIIHTIPAHAKNASWTCIANSACSVHDAPSLLHAMSRAKACHVSRASSAIPLLRHELHRLRQEHLRGRRCWRKGAHNDFRRARLLLWLRQILSNGEGHRLHSLLRRLWPRGFPRDPKGWPFR